MSTLRDQLQSAARTHQAMRYPGNLADEILGDVEQQRQRQRMRIFPWTVTAIAAALLLSVISYRLYPLLMKSNSVVINEDEQFSLALPEVDFQVPEKPEIPAGVDLMPTYQALSVPTFPSFPSMDSLKEQSDQDLSNSQESVL